MEREIEELEKENTKLKTYLAAAVAQIETQKTSIQNLDSDVKSRNE